MGAMPIYEFRCFDCDTVFEEKRSLAAAGDPAPACPNGHVATRRVLSLFATAGVTSAPATACGAPLAAAGGCGGGCACAANA